MSSNEQWSEVAALFDAALEQPTGQRLAWLARACPDEALRGSVERMVTAHERTSGALEKNLPDAHLGVEEPTRTMPEPFHGGVGPRNVGPYRLMRMAGRGGMGVVYQAHDSRLDRDVALKVLSRQSADPDAVTRFLAEAKAASALDHPNICTIYDVGETNDGLLYIAMAYYEGETLAQRIARGPLDVDEAVDLALQVAGGLARAHAAGIVHRDVKPGNLMLPMETVHEGTRGNRPDKARPDRIKILDFGIAKLEGGQLTRSGATPGTLAYMAPEQLEGENVDPRTDLWALGVVLYEMLSGKLPFQGEMPSALIRSILLEEPRALRALRPDVPEALEQVVAKTLSKPADERPACAAELAAELEKAKSLTPNPESSRAGAPAPPPSAARRGVAWALLAGLTVTLLAVLALVQFAPTEPAEPPPPRQELAELVVTSSAPESVVRNATGLRPVDPAAGTTLQAEDLGEGQWKLHGHEQDVANAAALLSIHDALRGHSFAEESHRWTGAETSERLLTFSLEEIDTIGFLRFVAEAAGWSVVFDSATESESGRLTLSLREVPWDAAVESIFERQGLSATRYGEVWLVASHERNDEIARLVEPSVFIDKPRSISPAALATALSAASSEQGVVVANERLGVVVLADRVDTFPNYARIWSAIEGDSAPELPTRYYQGEPINISLSEADLRELLQSFIAVAAINLVLPEDLEGSVSLNLNSVAWDNVLDVILLSFGLRAHIEANVGTVRPLGVADLRIETVRLEREDPAFFTVFERCLTGRGRMVVEPASKALILSDVEDRVLWLRRLIERVDAIGAPVVP